MHDGLCATPAFLHVVEKSVQIKLQFLVRIVRVCRLAKQVGITLIQPSVESYNIIPGPFFRVAGFEQLSHAVQSHRFGVFFHNPFYSFDAAPGSRYMVTLPLATFLKWRLCLMNCITFSPESGSHRR